MDKQAEFLWIVQTATLANAINLASNPERADLYRHEVSATGVYSTADEAVRASRMIPADMSAGEAAHDFIFFMLSNLREAEGAAQVQRCPAWFARR